MPKTNLRMVKGTEVAGFRLTGGEKMYALLAALPDRVAANVTRGAPNSAAKMLRDAIRANTYSSGFERETGDLKKAIKNRRHEPRDDSGRRIPGAVVYVEHGGRARYDAFYWRFLEYGTFNISAHPFVRPAIEANKHRVEGAMADYVRKRFEKEAAKAR